jgi:hypothetical protein
VGGVNKRPKPVVDLPLLEDDLSAFAPAIVGAQVSKVGYIQDINRMESLRAGIAGAFGERGFDSIELGIPVFVVH